MLQYEYYLEVFINKFQFSPPLFFCRFFKTDSNIWVVMHVVFNSEKHPPPVLYVVLKVIKWWPLAWIFPDALFPDSNGRMGKIQAVVFGGAGIRLASQAHQFDNKFDPSYRSWISFCRWFKSFLESSWRRQRRSFLGNYVGRCAEFDYCYLCGRWHTVSCVRFGTNGLAY